MADRIEAGTFCVAATLTKGNLDINNFDAKIIQTELNLLKKFGAKIKTNKKKISIKGPEIIKSVRNIKTKEYPGIATDLQSQLMVLMCKANGRSSLRKIFLKIDLCMLQNLEIRRKDNYKKTKLLLMVIRNLLELN